MNNISREGNIIYLRQDLIAHNRAKRRYVGPSQPLIDIEGNPVLQQERGLKLVVDNTVSLAPKGIWEWLRITSLLFYSSKFEPKPDDPDDRLTRAFIARLLAAKGMKP